MERRKDADRGDQQWQGQYRLFYILALGRLGSRFLCIEGRQPCSPSHGQLLGEN